MVPSLSRLASAELMEDQALLADIDDCSVIKGFEFVKKLGFFRKVLEDSDNLVVNLLCGIIVGKTGTHWD